MSLYFINKVTDRLSYFLADSNIFSFGKGTAPRELVQLKKSDVPIFRALSNFSVYVHSQNGYLPFFLIVVYLSMSQA
jgi:hypothetical protein